MMGKNLLLKAKAKKKEKRKKELVVLCLLNQLQTFT